MSKGLVVFFIVFSSGCVSMGDFFNIGVVATKNSDAIESSLGDGVGFVKRSSIYK